MSSRDFVVSPIPINYVLPVLLDGRYQHLVIRWSGASMHHGTGDRAGLMYCITDQETGENAVLYLSSVVGGGPADTRKILVAPIEKLATMQPILQMLEEDVVQW